MSVENRKCTVAEYLAQRLAEMGIRHLFAVPGNYCADFLMATERLGAISVIGTTNKLEAGYAADALVSGIQKAKHPVIWGGEEIHRFGLQDDFERLTSTSGLPYATTLLGKSIISEDNSRFIGVYDSKFAPRETRRIVETSDCLIALGTTISDFIGDVVARDFGNMILAVQDGLRIGHHTYPEIVLGDFVRQLTISLAEAKFVWLSIGYTTGGTVGASFAHNEGPVVAFTGDGGVHMIPQMLSTLARHKRSAVIFLFNNKIYGFEQFLVNSQYFKEAS